MAFCALSQKPISDDAANLNRQLDSPVGFIPLRNFMSLLTNTLQLSSFKSSGIKKLDDISYKQVFDYLILNIIPHFWNRTFYVLLWGIFLRFFVLPIFLRQSPALDFRSPAFFESLSFFGSSSFFQKTLSSFRRKTRQMTVIGDFIYDKMKCLLLFQKNSKKKKQALKNKKRSLPNRKDKLLLQQGRGNQQAKRNGVFLGICHSSKSASAPFKKHPSRPRFQKDLSRKFRRSKPVLSRPFFVFLRTRAAVVDWVLHSMFVAQLASLFLLSHFAMRFVWPVFILQNIVALLLSLFAASEQVSKIAAELKLRKKSLFWFFFRRDLVLNSVLLLVSLMHFVHCLSVSSDGQHLMVYSHIYFWLLFFKFLRFCRLCVGPLQPRTLLLLLDILSDFKSMLFMYLVYFSFNFLCFQILLLLIPLCFELSPSPLVLLSDASFTATYFQTTSSSEPHQKSSSTSICRSFRSF